MAAGEHGQVEYHEVLDQPPEGVAVIEELCALLQQPSSAAIRWSHATNSQAELAEALTGGRDGGSTVDFIEADVRCEGGVAGGEPIMAHPPAIESDLSLREMLTRVRDFNNDDSNDDVVALKLDVKDPGAVRRSLELVRELWPVRPLDDGGVRPLVPLWFNADIFDGPCRRKAKFDAREFLQLCQEMAPWAHLSVGWTVHFNAGLAFGLGGYERDKHVNAALDVMNASFAAGGGDGPEHVTFPVRATEAAQSADVLIDVLREWDRCSLTVWGEAGPVEQAFIRRVARELGPYRIFVDTKPPGELLSYLTLVRTVAILAMALLGLSPILLPAAVGPDNVETAAPLCAVLATAIAASLLVAMM